MGAISLPTGRNHRPSFGVRDGLGVLACCGVATVVFLAGPAQIGFISDDYVLLKLAATIRWPQPLERHHYAPVMAAMWNLTAQGVIGPLTWHLVALVAHGVNILLVWRILVRCLAVNRWPAWAITFLFALNAPGYESLAWPCALGYVLVATPILAAMQVTLSAATRSPAATRLALLGLQLAALATWDWGALLTPIAVLCFLLYDVPHKRARWREAAGIFWPVVACWAALLIGRTACGYSPGYSNVPLSFFRVGYFLLTSGVRIVFPNGSIHFCRTPWGMAWTLGIVVFLAAWSRFDVRIRLLTVLFFLWQGPYVVFGATESRYFYLSSVFALGAVVLGITQFRRRWLGFGLVFALVVCHAVWSFDRALLWKGDYREAQRIKARLEALAAGAPDGQLVVVNLPDHYGPPDLLWKPTMWRNGVQAIRAQILRVNTPDCPFSWVDSGIPTMSREAIAAQYPRQPICEVMWSEPVSDSSSGQWQHFVVVPWKVHLPAAAAKNRDSPP